MSVANIPIRSAHVFSYLFSGFDFLQVSSYKGGVSRGSTKLENVIAKSEELTRPAVIAVVGSLLLPRASAGSEAKQPHARGGGVIDRIRAIFVLWLLLEILADDAYKQ